MKQGKTKEIGLTVSDVLKIKQKKNFSPQNCKKIVEKLVKLSTFSTVQQNVIFQNAITHPCVIIGFEQL